MLKKITPFIIVLLMAAQLPGIAKAEDTQIYDDLYAESIVVNPVSPAVGQSCQITVKIKNNGTRGLQTSKGISTFLYRFDNFQMTKLTYDTPSYSDLLLPGEYEEYVFEGKFSATGEANLYFFADNIDELPEEKLNDEGFTIKLNDNNEVSKKVTIVSAGGVDVSVYSTEVSETSPVINDFVDITYKVKNSGTVSITDGTMLDRDNISFSGTNFVISSTSLPTMPTQADPFDPGEYLIYQYRGYFVSYGTQSASFKVDSNSRVAEAFETNNSTTTVFSVYKDQAAADDFTISSPEVMPLSSSSFAVKWTTSRETTGKAVYKQTVYATDQFVASTDTVSPYDAVISGLTPGEYYYVGVTAVYNTLTKSTELARYKLPATDDLALSGAASVNVSGSGAEFNWTTNLGTDSYVFYRKKGEGDYVKSGQNELVLAHKVSLSGLSQSVYEYYITGSSTKSSVQELKRGEFTISGDSSSSSSNASSVSTSNSGTASELRIMNQGMYGNLKGKIILTVEQKGEAYYLSQQEMKMYYLGRPADAFQVMRQLGQGITNSDLNKIPVGTSALTGTDTDKDGFPDLFEDAIGTDKNKADSDGDGFFDKTELVGGFNPKGAGKLSTDATFSGKQKGKILLQVQSHGEAWYINPTDGKRYFLGRPADAFAVMRTLGIGISNVNFEALQ